jgi:hypothetical protein
MGRSILAVVAGAIVMVVGVVAANFMLVVLVPAASAPGGASGHVTALAVLLLFNLLVGVVGGYVTARVAARAPERHALALALGIVQVALYAASALVERGGVPLWWHAGMVLFLVPAVLLGGQLRASQIPAPASSSV